MGDFIIPIVVVIQIAVAVFVSKLLFNSLGHSLIESALEKLSAFNKEKIDGLEGAVRVITARPLTPQQKEQLKNIKDRKFQSVEFDFIENEEIKGGMIIIAGEHILDCSVLTRIKQLFKSSDE